MRRFGGMFLSVWDLSLISIIPLIITLRFMLKSWEVTWFRGTAQLLLPWLKFTLRFAIVNAIRRVSFLIRSDLLIWGDLDHYLSLVLMFINNFNSFSSVDPTWTVIIRSHSRVLNISGAARGGHPIMPLVDSIVVVHPANIWQGWWLVKEHDVAIWVVHVGEKVRAIWLQCYYLVVFKEHVVLKVWAIEALWLVIWHIVLVWGVLHCLCSWRGMIVMWVQSVLVDCRFMLLLLIRMSLVVGMTFIL